MEHSTQLAARTGGYRAGTRCYRFLCSARSVEGSLRLAMDTAYIYTAAVYCYKCTRHPYCLNQAWRAWCGWTNVSTEHNKQMLVPADMVRGHDDTACLVARVPYRGLLPLAMDIYAVAVNVTSAHGIHTTSMKHGQHGEARQMYERSTTCCSYRRV